MFEARSIPELEVQSVFFLYGLSSGVKRGGHARRRTLQVLIAVCGGFEIQTFDGFHTTKVILDSPTSGLFVEPLTWLDFECLEKGSILLVIASNIYDESDYIRDKVAYTRQVQSDQR